jgi:hypothetical protein
MKKQIECESGSNTPQFWRGWKITCYYGMGDNMRSQRILTWSPDEEKEEEDEVGKGS